MLGALKRKSVKRSSMLKNYFFSIFLSSEVQNKYSEFIFLSSENWHVVTG